MGVRPSDLAGLSVDEKLDLISELWDSIDSEAVAPTLTDDQQQELQRRRIAGLSDPGTTESWTEVRGKLFRKP